jgi:hypothetical protein
MTTNYNIALNQNNDEVVQLSFTDADPLNSGTPYPLTGAINVEFFIKASKTATDLSGTMLSTQGGQITITNAQEGICTVAIPAADIAAAGALWWRADVVGTSGSPRKTAGFGYLNITAM